MTWTSPLAAMVAGAAANAQGDRALAIRSLRSAIELAQAADMSMYAAAARHQLGRLLPADEGDELVLQARDQMTAQEIHVPDRFAKMLLPGHWGTER